MTQISRPWNGVVTGDAGPYSDQEWHEAWRNALGFGASRFNYGPIRGNDDSSNDCLSVREDSPASANVVVSPGSALVRGLMYTSDADETLAIAANASGNPRIDVIVLRADFTAQTVRRAVRQGTPAASPVAPALTQTDGVLWEIPLADIAVANGFVSISQANITPNAHFANIPNALYLDNVLNNSGALLETGDVVIVDTTTDRAVTTTTTFNNALIAGVWVGRTADGDLGRVQVEGIGWIRTSAAVASRNLTFVSNTVAGEATTTSHFSANELGRSLETTAVAGLCLAWIGVRRMKPLDYIILQDQKAQNTAGGTATSGSWQTRTLNTEVVDTGNHCTLAANQFTLQPGIYRIRAGAPANGVGSHQARLQNITGGTTTLEGTSERVNTTGNTSHSFIIGRFTITAATVFEIQHQVQVTVATNGFGNQANFTTEIYTTVEIWKEA
jgi:hypothetical protein